MGGVNGGRVESLGDAVGTTTTECSYAIRRGVCMWFSAQLTAVVCVRTNMCTGTDRIYSIF